MKRKFKLLNKVVFLYLIFTFAAFIISALILRSEANKHMYKILENRFDHRARWVTKVLEHNPAKLRKIDHTIAEEVDSIPHNFQPVYKDTLMVNQQTSRRRMYLKKIDYVQVNEKTYRLIMFKEAEELYRFKDDIFHIFLPILGIFTIIIILGNYALSGWLFDPFKRILKQMASYTIGKGNIEEPIKTSTKEFHQLKTLYRDLRSRIENDYFQLKEYTENMSHELQTPLSVIQNKTEVLLSDENLNYDHALKLKIIYDEVQQLSKLSSSLNLLTKIENNEFQNIQTIPTAPVIRNHINKIREFADMKELKIEAELNEQHTFTIDPSLLDILIRNLLRNALRYSETSSTIHIITDAIKLQIINTGDQTDFPSEDIFNRFQKNKNHNSLGLGLAIVKKICTVNKLDISYNFSNRNHIFTIR